MRRGLLTIGFVVMTVAGTATLAAALPGDLDTTFDGDGVAFADFALGQAVASGVVLNPNNGRVIVAGLVVGATVDFALTRLNTDGTVDTGFGTGGLTTTDFNGSTDYGEDVALAPDGKIVVVGLRSQGVQQRFAVARYRRGGRLDASSSGNGKVSTSIGGLDLAKAFAVAVQDDGRIVAAGTAYGTNVTIDDFALARYNVDGTLDSAFDGDGLVTTDFALDNDDISDVAIQTDGKVVAAGYSEDGAGNTRAAVARYNDVGTPDTAFSTDGLVTTTFSGSSSTKGWAMAIQTDDKILVVGQDGDTGSDFMMLRYNVDGTLDTGFSGDGKKTVDFGGSDVATAVAIQSDGRIVVAGYTDVSGTLDFAVVRLESDGRLDTTYGTGGQLTVDLGGDEEYQDSVVQADDKLVGVGFAYGTGNTAIAVTRHLAA